MKKQSLLALVLSACIGISGILGAGDTVLAAAEQGEEKLGTVTSMDENGNITETDSSAKRLEGSDTSTLSKSEEPMIVNFRTKSNAVTEYKEDKTGEAGYTNGAYGADGAYLGRENGKVKFMLSGVVGIVSGSEVQVAPLSQAKDVSHYEVSGGKLIHIIIQDLTGTSSNWKSRLNNGPAPSYLGEGEIYYSYDGHYFYTDYKVMLEDYKKGNREHAVNPDHPYYNYYQYLPMRSKTVYSGEEMDTLLNTALQEKNKTDSLMKDTGAEFIEMQDTYGVNGLLAAGIAANESAWGTSSISKNKKNLFGLKAYDASPGSSAASFQTVSDCIQDFAEGWMSRGYLCPKDYRYKGGYLGNKASGINLKYASDPYWGEKAANIAWSLDESQGGKDAGRYTLGIKETIPGIHTAVNVRKEATTSSASLYKTAKESNFAVLLLDSQPVNGFYKIQSDPVLTEDRSKIEEKSGVYDYGSMYAYLSSDYITVIPQEEGVETPEETPDDTEPEAPAPEDPAPETPTDTPSDEEGEEGEITPAPDQGEEQEGEGEPEEKEPVLKSISITTAPAKTIYTEGEFFDPAGMTVVAEKSDGTTADVTSMITYEKEPLSVGQTGVVIRYTEGERVAEAIQEIQVSKKQEDTFTLTQDKSLAKAGDTVTFIAQKNGENLSGQAVDWEVSGAADPETKITSEGKLEIASEETAEKLTVKAVLKEDTSKTAQTTVTIKAEESVVKGSQVIEGQEKKTSAKTADATQPLFWCLLAAGAFGIMISVSAKRKKKKG